MPNRGPPWLLDELFLGGCAYHDDEAADDGHDRALLPLREPLAVHHVAERGDDDRVRRQHRRERPGVRAVEVVRLLPKE